MWWHHPPAAGPRPPRGELPDPVRLAAQTSSCPATTQKSSSTPKLTPCTQKSTLFSSTAGRVGGAGEAANMAKYAAAEASVRAVDQAVQTLGGSSMTAESGLAAMLASVRTTRIAPVSREMILNFVAQHSLGLPKSY